MPIRELSFATGIKEVSQNVTIPRGEALDIVITPAGLDLALTVAATAGGERVLEIPCTNSRLEVRPAHYALLKEGSSYFGEIWNVSDDHPIRLASGKFSAANSIHPGAVQFATLLFAGAGSVVILSQAEYSAGPLDPDTVYVITDTGEIWARGARVATGAGSSAPDPVAAPVAAGGLADRKYTQDTGDQVVDAAGDFQNASGGTWAAAGAGATINAAGVVTIPTGSLRSAVTVSVTYTNAAGSATTAFSVTVAAVAVPENLAAVSISPASLSLGDTFTVAATVPDGEAIVALRASIGGQIVSLDAVSGAYQGQAVLGGVLSVELTTDTAFAQSAVSVDVGAGLSSRPLDTPLLMIGASMAFAVNDGGMHQAIAFAGGAPSVDFMSIGASGIKEFWMQSATPDAGIDARSALESGANMVTFQRMRMCRGQFI